MSLFKANSGFTLIELLLTILLLSVLLLLPTFYSKPNDQMIEEQAIQKLRDDLVYTQHLAMTQGFRTSVSFVQNELLLSVNGEVVERFDYPVRLEVKPVSMDIHDVSFLANGNPSRAGSFHVLTEKRSVQFTIQVGKGRVVYRQL